MGSYIGNIDRGSGRVISEGSSIPRALRPGNKGYAIEVAGLGDGGVRESLYSM